VAEGRGLNEGLAVELDKLLSVRQDVKGLFTLLACKSRKGEMVKHLAFLAVLLLVVALTLGVMGCGGSGGGGGGATSTPTHTSQPTATLNPTATAKPTATPKLTATPISASGLMVHRGVAEYSNGAHVTFPTAFQGIPVVVASAQLNNSAKSVCALNISSAGFDVALTNLWGAVETRTYWVQWIAVGPGAVDTSLAFVTNYVNAVNWMDAGFKAPFSGEPVVIVASAQNSGIPQAAGTTDVTRTGFELDLNGYQGKGGTLVQAWTSLIAVGPGTYDPKVLVQSGSGTYSHDTPISFSQAFAGAPVVVVNAQSGNTPQIASSLNITASGFTVLVIDHNGNGVSNASVQWIAVGLAP
jgi:hypothetical protein